MISNSLSCRPICPWKKVARVGLLVMKASLFLPFPLFSQTRALATASIPFSFSAGTQTMPAGQYRLSQVNGSIFPLAQVDGATFHQIVAINDAPDRK